MPENTPRKHEEENKDMSDIRGNFQSSTVTRLSGGDQLRQMRITADGALYTADWFQAQLQEGRMYCANAGTASSPITFGAGSIDTTEPDLHIAVPSGTTLVLAELRLVMETFGTTAIFEVMASYGTGGTAGTDTAVTPTNLRSDAPLSSAVTVGDASAADATYTTTNVVEFWREGAAKAVTVGTADDDSAWPPTSLVWSYKTAGFAPVLIGASQLQVFAAAQAGTGFITAIWAEVPSTSITA